MGPTPSSLQSVYLMYEKVREEYTPKLPGRRILPCIKFGVKAFKHLTLYILFTKNPETNAIMLQSNFKWVCKIKERFKKYAMPLLYPCKTKSSYPLKVIHIPIGL